MFLATLEGTINKYIRLPDSDETCLIEVIQLHDDVRGHVTTLELLANERALLVSTGSEIIRLPLQRCHKHNTQQ